MEPLRILLRVEIARLLDNAAMRVGLASLTGVGIGPFLSAAARLCDVDLTIIVRKTGGIWHGTIEGCLDVDERGLTPEIAERKARELAANRFADRGLRISVQRVDP